MSWVNPDQVQRGFPIATLTGYKYQYKKSTEEWPNNWNSLDVNATSYNTSVTLEGLDEGTAFEILSIDIADVDVGRNIGASLMTDQAEADKRIAQAKAEQRRAMAVAKEQEMKAYTQEMKAKVVEAEAKVPEAMADALRQGRLGVMDYYRMNNINADTQMRKAISGTDTPEEA